MCVTGNLKVCDILGCNIFPTIINVILGRGCGAVGRAVTTDTGDPRFKSQHKKIIFLNVYLSIAI